MDAGALKKVSKVMSYVLRHRPGTAAFPQSYVCKGFLLRLFYLQNLKT